MVSDIAGMKMGPKILLVLALIFSLQCVGLEAARRVDVRKRFAEGMERYSSWRQRRDAGDDSEPEPTPDELLGLETGEHLKDSTTITTAAGTTKEKLTETYEGLPVFGQSVVIETDDGEPTGSISGHLVEGLEDDIEDADPELSPQEALEVAVASMGDNIEDVDGDDVQFILEVYVEDQESTEEPISFLAYQLSYFIIRDGEPSRPTFIINADTGEIVRTWEGLTSRSKRQSRLRTRETETEVYVEGTGPYTIEAVGGNVKMGRLTYGDRFPALEIWQEEGVCYLENEKVTVIDASSGGRSYEAFGFGCEAGFNDSVNGAYSPMADAFFFGSMTYDLFMEWLGIEPLIFKIELVVHEGFSMENAFWDGTRTYFGDGMTTFYPLVVLDVVAHEVAHGFTEQHSSLIYSSQSGGMNEAFSDIAGAAAEEYMKSVDEWQIGEDAFKADNQALRYMINPSQDGVSIGDMQQYCGDIDVHYSSGLFNRAFYILSTMEGWNVRMAFQAMATANQLYWTPDSTFRAGACGVAQAAEDLGFNVADVQEAFSQVGIAPCGGVATGLDLLNDLQAIDNETLTFVFNLEEEGLEQLRIETYTSSYWYGIQWNLHVETPRRTLSAYPPDDSIIINLPEPGTYVVSMEATAAFQMADLYAIKSEVVLAENIEFDDSGLFNGSFTLPEEVVAAGQPIAIRCGYPHSDTDASAKPFIISYEQEPDFNAHLGDIMPCGRSNSKNNMYEAFIRNPQPGVYHYQIASSIGGWYYYYQPEENTEDLKLVMEALLMPEVPQ